MVPKNSLVRFQFLEILVRTAICKFYPNPCKTEAEAVEKLFKEHVVPYRSHIEHVHAHKWRINNLWVEPVDNVLKAYRDFFKDVYARYSEVKQPGKPLCMDMEDFMNLFIQVEDLFTEGGLAQRDLSLFFFQSMVTQVDEIGNDRHLSMNFSEFLEAITRAIDKASPPPY